MRAMRSVTGMNASRKSNRHAGRSGLRRCAVALGLLIAGFVGAAQAQVDGVWLYQRLTNPQKDVRVDMSFQLEPKSKRTLAVVCDARARLLLVVTPRQAAEEGPITFRIDDGDWIAAPWQAEEKRHVLAGDAARAAVGRIMFAHAVELRFADGQAGRYLASGLADSLARQEGRCLSPS